MSYLDQFETVAEPVQENVPRFAEERGTTMDILRDLYVGGGRAIDLLGRATDSGMLKGIASDIQKSDFARPDESQYFGTRDRAGRVTDMIFESLPTTLAIGGTAAAGTLVGGPVGGYLAGAGALGILGKGVYEQSYEEISKARPDLDEDSKFKYGITNALLEVGSEAIPFAGHLIGKAISVPAKKAALNALLDSKLVSADDLIGTAMKTVDLKRLIGGLFGSAVADGASEVVNELGQAANKQQYGLEQEPVDLIDVFLAGMVPSGAMTGGTVAMDARARSIVKSNVERGLTSEVPEVRMDMLKQVSEGLGNVHPELKDLWESKVGPLAQQGPIDLKTALGEQLDKKETLDKIIENPKAIIEEKLYTGMPKKEGMTELELENKRMVDLRNTMQDTQAAKRGPQPSEEMQVSLETELGQREELEKEKQRIALEMEGHAKRVKSFMETAPVEAGQIPDELIQGMKHESFWNTFDVESRRGIAEGMDKVDELSNQLKETTDLGERKKIRKEINNIHGLIRDELTTGLKRDIPGARADGLTPNQLRSTVKLEAFGDPIQMPAGEALRYLDDDISIYEQLRTCVGKS